MEQEREERRVRDSLMDGIASVSMLCRNIQPSAINILIPLPFRGKIKPQPSKFVDEPFLCCKCLLTIRMFS